MALRSAILPVLASHGRYPDESVLAEWLDDAGVTFEAADLPAALDGLWEQGLVIRPPVNSGSPRSGYLDNGRNDEGWLVTASGSRMYLRGGASARM